MEDLLRILCLNQAQAGKPAARDIDSLVKAAVQSRCSKKEIEQPPL